MKKFIFYFFRSYIISKLKAGGFGCQTNAILKALELPQKRIPVYDSPPSPPKKSLNIDDEIKQMDSSIVKPIVGANE